MTPQMNPEELYRRKLLEIERRTQEIERDAYSQGFAQGEKDGFDYGQKSVQVVKSQLERIAQNMEALPAKILQDYRDWLIRTSIGIARQIVNREVQTSPEIVADIGKGPYRGSRGARRPYRISQPKRHGDRGEKGRPVSGG